MEAMMALLRKNGPLPGEAPRLSHGRPTSSEQLHLIAMPKLGPEITDKTIAVRLANTNGQRNAARMLINRRYSWRGYGENHELESSGALMTFTAHDGENLIGTLSLAVDNGRGLNVDDTFPDEIKKFRDAPGARICELVRLAFDSNVPSKPLLASFFHIIFIYGQNRYNCTDLFIEVSVRHRRFYEAMLGFKRIGEPKINESVGVASQLMWLKVADIQPNIDRHAGQSQDVRTRSLYPYFFSQVEQQGIYARLAGNALSQPTKVPTIYRNLKNAFSMARLRAA